MRPSASLNEAIEPRPRKLSLADQIGQSNDRPPSNPVAFFLARGEDIDNETDIRPPSQKQDKVSLVQTLEETIEEAQDTSASKRRISQSTEQDGQFSRRRGSTIKGFGLGPRRASSIHSNAPSLRPDDSSTTPPLTPSQELSLASSPKSTSSRSLNRENMSSDDNSSQAVASSEDDDQEVSSSIQDSAPQLIMPSIRMPSRRPFTTRGKNMGRCKILVAGCKRSGKTSLIKSIVQVCEDIVHVDPLTSSNPSVRTTSDRTTTSRQSNTEIHASTKPYPTWWSDVDESKILRRRKSMGDSVLERNVCFVEAGNTEKVETVIQYLEQQLQRAIYSTTSQTSDFIGMLSGRGGSQVDVVLYLLSHETFQTDCERIRQLSEITNVVPLLPKSDLQSPEEITELKSRATDAQLPSALPRLPFFPNHDSQVESSTLISTATSPYTISALPGPDSDNMDASLLMSPEYVQPLLPTELSLLISQLFDSSVLAFLRHTASKKLVSWQATHPRFLSPREQSPSAPSFRSRSSTLNSPALMSSMTNSGVLVPLSAQSELSSLSPSTSYALARVADHTQREERLAQVRLSKWAADLQASLHRERERYERIARGERAIWLVERMGEELGNGNFDAQALVRMRGAAYEKETHEADGYKVHDPLGLLQWQDAMRTRGWIALQVMGSFGVVGGLVVWVVRTLNWNGLAESWGEWAEGWRGW